MFLVVKRSVINNFWDIDTIFKLKLNYKISFFFFLFSTNNQWAKSNAAKSHITMIRISLSNSMYSLHLTQNLHTN